ncbi:glucose/galactose MFS transporter [Kinneretia aquatilis]|uniref:glucose/galactose MFS transporter n=1 Tax=Kinneretia aquatilis TaxID=2070761 RepID=UPI001495198E|nr:glucose/galactose MFS transporter [Paucibacter aquatile]WIV99390.1 glucose/galactose MFS transporter [Paucibacter aquatile]
MNQQQTSSASRAGSTASSVVLAMLFIGLMFFILGFVTWLNGSLIPFLKIVCELNNFQALWVTFAFYIAYTVMALPSAAILARTGYKRGMTLSLAVMAVGALLFIPAAKVGHYGLFLLALFTLASGMTLMQTAINPYIVCIGARESAAMRISIMGLFNKGAGIVVPLVFSALILSGFDQKAAVDLAALEPAARALARAELAARLITPYLVMAGVLLVFTAVIHFSSLAEPDLDDAGDSAPVRLGEVFRFPQVVLGALSLFVYVGVEVIAGDTIGLYGQQLGVANYAVLTSYTMAAMVMGYLAGVLLIPRFISQKTALQASAALGVLLSAAVALSSSQDSGLSQLLLGWAGVPAVPNTVFCLAALGLANALVWPAVWPLALQDLGRHTASGSALLIMGIAGGALLPMAYGHFADASGPQSAYWVMLPCYVFILFYATLGHKLRHWGDGSERALKRA